MQRPSRPRVKLPPPPEVRPRAVLAPEEVAKIRARTMLDERVIRRYAEGSLVRASTAKGIQRACADLGIELLA